MIHYLSKVRINLIFILLCFLSTSSMGKLMFIENAGQWNSEILFKSEIPGGAIFITKDGIVYNLYDLTAASEIHENGNLLDKPHFISAHAFKIKFIDANSSAEIITGKPGHLKNYIKGENPKFWKSNVHTFETIRIKDLYPHIDVIYSSDGQQLKYDFILYPGAQLENISMIIEGANNYYLNENKIIIQTTIAKLVEEIPASYIKRNGTEIREDIQYSIKENRIKFTSDLRFPLNDTLIIDPLVKASTYSGSAAQTYGSSATYDSNGNIIIGALVFDIGWPYTLGAYNLNFNGGIDMGLTKFDSTGTNQIWSTYLGGSYEDIVLNLVCNSNDELFIFGYSYIDYPITSGSFDNSPNGQNDIVISRLSSDGTQLLNSTYIGGNADDAKSLNLSMNVHSFGDLDKGEIYLDSSGNIIVSTLTESTNFPTTTNAYQTVSGGAIDACIFKMSSDLSTVIFSSYLGGSGDDAAYGFCIDKNGNYILTGGTNSLNFPVTTGSYQPNYSGGLSFQFDSFISKISSDGSNLIASTYFGYTNGKDKGYKTDVDSANNIYVFGNSEGILPVSPGVFSNQNRGNYVIKLDPQLSSLLLCTSYGDGSNSVNLQPIAFHIDPCNQIYCAAFTSSVLGSPSNFPVTPNAQQPSHNGLQDFHIMVFAPDFASMLYGSHLGGAVREHTDAGSSKFDSQGTLYLGVCTEESFAGGFPTLPNGFSPTSQTPDWDMVAVKWSFDLCQSNSASPIASFNITNNFSCDSNCLLLTNTSNGIVDSTQWFINNQFYSSQNQIMLCSDSIAQLLINLIVCNSSGCDTTIQSINLNNPIISSFYLGPDTSICNTDTILLLGPNGNYNYMWYSNGNLQQQNSSSLIVTTPATYVLQVSDTSGCTKSDTIKIDNLIPLLNLGSDQVYCPPQSINLAAPNDISQFLWILGTDTVSTDSNVVINQPGILYFEGTYTNSCKVYDTVQIYNDSYNFQYINDTINCDSSGLIIHTTAGANNYEWSLNGINLNNNISSLQVTQSGTYILEVQSSTGCVYRDTFNVDFSNNPEAEFTYITQVTCSGWHLNLVNTSSNAVEYIWSGPNVYSALTNPHFNLETFTSLPLSLIAINGQCRDTLQNLVIPPTDSLDFVSLPNIITPNNDGINDCFNLKNLDNYSECYSFQVFNRWGNMVYSTSNQLDCFNGKSSAGTDLPEGVYFYLIKAGIHKFENTIHVYR